jgi:hypothetical protein
VSCRSESSHTGVDDRAQTFAQAFSHSLHGNIVSKSKSKTTLTPRAPKPSTYDRMIEDILRDHSPLEPVTGTGFPMIADIPYGNIGMPQLPPAGDRLVASTTAKNSIFQDYNAKFRGPSGRSVITKTKGEVDTMSAINYPTQRQLVQSLALKPSLDGQYWVKNISLHHVVILLIKEG